MTDDFANSIRWRFTQPTQLIQKAVYFPDLKTLKIIRFPRFLRMFSSSFNELS
jgi:hypothetical protein